MSFGAQIELFVKNVRTRQKTIVKKIVLDLFRVIVNRSPVRTGRYRSGHQIDLNGMSSSSLLTFKVSKSGKARVTIPSASQTTMGAMQKMSAFELGQTVFIYNNIEYAIALEQGRSRQAPEGIYRVSVLEMINYLKTVGNVLP